MFQFSYTPFLSARFRHPYYADGVTNDFQFVPTPSSLENLTASGLRYKNIGGTLFLHQQLDEHGEPVAGIDTVTDLFFIITPTSDLLNITERFDNGKYFFTNLKTDGTYNAVLTAAATLSPGDALQKVSSQHTVLDFEPNTLSKVSVSKIVAGTGWKVVHEYPVPPTAHHLEFFVNEPGWYQVEKFKKAGGTEIVQVLMSDEISSAGNVWSILHLQLKPADVLTHYTVDLPPIASFWQYLVVEPLGRIGGVLTPSKLAMKCNVMGSRYPATLSLGFLPPASYSDQVKKKVNAIKALPRIRDVYLFQSNNPVTLMDGEQPKLKILYNTDELATKVVTPSRDKSETTLIYKL